MEKLTGTSLPLSARDLRNRSTAWRDQAVLTEREGFEPSMGLYTPYSLSRRVPSATRPPLLEWRLYAAIRDPTGHCPRSTADRLAVRPAPDRREPPGGARDRARRHGEGGSERNSRAGTALQARRQARPDRQQPLGRPEREPAGRLRPARPLRRGGHHDHRLARRALLREALPRE